MNTQDIPVLLITGYLGSGKTTLLKNILHNEQGLKFAVIVNDLGEINIDGELIQHEGVVAKNDASLVTLQNGCICCTLQNDLVEQVFQLMKLQCFDYIVIEASGICDPVPIAQTLCTIPMLGKRFNDYGKVTLDCIATVVDALRIKSEFDGGKELTNSDLEEDDIAKLLIQQIEFCNLILLNKASEVSPEDLERIQQIIHTLQPKAEIICCDYAQVDLHKLVSTHDFKFGNVASSAGWIQEMGNCHEEHKACGGDHHHEDEACACGGHDHHEEEHVACACGSHHHHHHEEGEAEAYGITTFVYYRRAPFDMEKFDQFINECWQKNIIRAKGMCYFSNDRNLTYVFEQAGMQKELVPFGPWYAALSEEDIAHAMQRDPNLARDWDEQYGDRMQKLVFIGQHLDKESLEKGLDACLVE